MGFFDSNSSSATSNLTQNTQDNETLGNNAQMYSVEGESTLTLNQMDGGAITGAFDLVKSSDTYSNKNYEALLKTTGESLKSIVGASSSLSSELMSGIASTQATAKGTLDNKTIMMIVVAAAAVLGIYFLKGRA